MQKAKKPLSKKQVQRILWNKGVLRWKCHSLQEKIYDQFYNDDEYITTLLISRQTGKSFLMCLIASETCIRTPNAIVKYVCPKKAMVKNILEPIMREIFEDCPDDLRPEYKEADKRYIFPNGSQIQMAGTDNKHYNSIRGGKSHLWIVDEAGFCDDLETVVGNVLDPTTLTTGGRGIMASTPDPEKPEHPFVDVYCAHAELKGKLFKYTIADNPLINEKQKKEIEERYIGGRNNPRFKAEYLCEVSRDGSGVVIPEFDEELEKAIVVDDYERPKYFDAYMSMDIGGKDFTAILFAYFDFMQNKVVIEDEYIMREKQNSTEIAKAIHQKCYELWAEKPTYLNFADNNNHILLNDLQHQHNINFIMTRKDNKEAAINNVRVKLLNEQIIIHSRCKTLIHHIKKATWAKSRSNESGYKKFARGRDGGHYDALDALIYLIRNVVYGKNPYPSGYTSFSSSHSFIRDPQKGPGETLNKLFKVRKSLKN